MPVVKQAIKEPGVYFITFTNYNWLPLIHMADAYSYVYKWFDHLVKSGHELAGYVIMPNHVHVLIGFNNLQQSINTIVGNGKRFIAYAIVEQLREKNFNSILTQLSVAVHSKDKERNKKHEVFEPSFDIKECRSLSFLNQKLKYMHDNPLAKKWNLAPDAISYYIVRQNFTKQENKVFIL